MSPCEEVDAAGTEGVPVGTSTGPEDDDAGVVEELDVVVVAAATGSDEALSFVIVL
jgi:hypothetical protein